MVKPNLVFLDEIRENLATFASVKIVLYLSL